MADFKIKSAVGTGNKTLLQSQDQTGSNYAIQIGDAGATTLTNATLTTATMTTATIGTLTDANMTGGSIGDAVGGGAGLSKVNFHEQWYLTTSFEGAITGTGVNGWTEFGNYGTGAMVCTSGTWTFPSTGYWQIDVKWTWNNANLNTTAAPWVEGMIKTVISGSKTIVDYQYSNWANNSGTDYGTSYGSYIYDVTNTTTHKLELATQGGATVRTSAGISNTKVTFTRLGDT